MLCVVAEVTERVIGERQLRVLRDVGTTLAAASTRAEVMAGLTACLATEARDVPAARLYLAGQSGAFALAASHDPAGTLSSFAGLTAQPAGAKPVLIDLDAILPAPPSRDPNRPRQALVSPSPGPKAANRWATWSRR